MATGNITSLGALTSGTATCSPISEVYNATSDLIFLSVTTLGNKTGCSGACVYSFNPAISTSVPVAGLTANGGTGTIIIDNTSTAAGASQIYYTTLSSQACGGNGSVGAGTGACAVQASQAALQ
jgi:hypothetical protein